MPGKLVLKKDSVAVDPNTDPNIASVSLLLSGNGINGSTSIIDSSPSPKTVTAVGNAQISTAQSKFGGASIAINGTGNYLLTPDNSAYDFGTGDLTVELWANFSVSTSGASYALAMQGIGAFNNDSGWSLLRHSSNKLRFIFTSDGVGASGFRICDSTNDFLPATGIWYHLAVTRNGNTLRVFIDGVQSGTFTGTQAIFNSSRQLSIGADESGGTALSGYIDDLRITKGVARYTANFTPPTAPFPNYGRDADANAYMSAVEAADGQPLELATRLAITDFVVGCKADGIWTAIKASCILAGARTLAGALVPLVGTAPTNNNFVSGDYARKTGLVGDGSTKYLAQSNPATPLQNSAHQAIYLSTNTTTTAVNFATHIAEWPSSGTDGRTQISTNTTQTFTRCRETTGVLLGSTSLGLNGISRFNSANYIRRIGQANATVTEASTGIPNQTIYVFNNGGGQYSNARLAFYSIGESLDLALLDARVTTLVNALSAAIP